MSNAAWKNRWSLAVCAMAAVGGLLPLSQVRAADPDFGPNVIMVDAATATAAQTKINAIFKTQERGETSEHRYAILIKPGDYKDLKIPVGFYTSVIGLGKSPDDVQVGTITASAHWNNTNATLNFWRAVENLATDPGERPMDWSVSQATALRRIHVKGDLHLWEDGWSSGGFIADSLIDGKCVSGSQQQWLTRNTDWDQWNGGVFNMVFVGVSKPPGGEWPEKPITVIDSAPVIREKPYLVLEGDQYEVIVPGLRHNATGRTWGGSSAATDKTIKLDDFYIAHAGKDDAPTINKALDAGKNILFTPGVYKITGEIHVTKPDTVVMGIGYPTLRMAGGTKAIAVDDVDGVTLAGLLIEAGEKESDTLVEVGPAGSKASHEQNPIALFDIFTRAGGSQPGRAKVMMTINSNNVIGDNFWLWRADHGVGAGWTENLNDTGMIVNGADATMYGMFIEHGQKYQTIWNGENGKCFFYQSELPYDPPSQDAWGNDGKGYASYKVADNVKVHEAHGLGIYAIFLKGAVVCQSAIEAPTGDGIKINHVVICRFTGVDGSGIAHIINGTGPGVMKKKDLKADSAD